MQKDGSVTVVTATVGHPHLGRALQSVCDQTYANVRHWVVLDGPEVANDALPVCGRIWSHAHARTATTLVLPERTGMDGWCSHRIYSAIPTLVSSEFVCFLDQDNWFEPEHVEELVAAARSSSDSVAYSLRSIHDPVKGFVCRDECQSLGPLAPSFDTPGEYHIDSNCWLLPTRLAWKFSTGWLQKYQGDRRFARAIIAACPGLRCTHRYSVNYTVGSRAESPSADYFLHGNQRRSFG
jgi:hypothetical protein